MAQAFIFEAFTADKVFGSTQAPVEMIIVKNAADKAAARVLAEANVEKGLRMVGAGRAYKNERDAVVDAGKWCTLFNNNKKPGQRKAVWFAVDAKPSETNIRLQRQLAALVGM